MLKTVAILPARYASSRFPGKPLALILGRPMIWWTATRAAKASLIERVVVATDDQRIHTVVTQMGLECIMTSSEHDSGTDRVAEVASALNAEIIINVQGDEPLIEPKVLDALVQALLESSCGIATLAAPSFDPVIFQDPDRVKVVIDANSHALYFSRSPIPYHRDRFGTQADCLLHVGIYAFTKETLIKFTALGQSPLERLEKLEQLRALENGIPIKVVLTDFVGHSVDRPDDLAAAESRLAFEGEQRKSDGEEEN